MDGMDGKSGSRRLVGYLPHAVVATFAVAVLPVLVVFSLEAGGLIASAWLSIGLSVALSAGAAALGSVLWARRPGARDLVFGDLLLWGWIRRLRSEKSIAEMIDRLGADGPGAGSDPDLPPERRIELLKKLASALEARDPYTHGHTERVARHSFMIAKAMGLSAAETVRIRTAAAVHDVGKLHVPDEVLNKPGKLTDEEFALMKGHSAAGASMVSAVGDDELTALVRYHHKRIDGRGYPDGLSGTEIPLGARIIAVADTFDAITSTRSYRSACPHKKAIDILKNEAGAQLDADAVNAFLTYYSGRSSRAWWWALSTAPQRLLARLIVWLQQAGVARVATTALAMGGAVTTVAAPAPAAVVHEARATSGAELAASPSADPSGRVVLAATDRDGKRGRADRARKRRDGHGKKGNGNGKHGRGSDEPGEESPGNDPETPGDQPDDPGGPVDDVTDGVGDAVDDVTDGVGDVVDGVGDAVDDVTDGIGGAVDDVTDGVGGAVDDVTDGVDDLVDGLLP